MPAWPHRHSYFLHRLSGESQLAARLLLAMALSINSMIAGLIDPLMTGFVGPVMVPALVPAVTSILTPASSAVLALHQNWLQFPALRSFF
jgi:hypothetical protein